MRDDYGIGVMCQTSQDVLDCIIAFITEAVVVREILGHLGEPTSPPRLLPARGPPLWEMQGAEPGEIDPQAQPASDYQFDQRIAW